MAGRPRAGAPPEAPAAAGHLLEDGNEVRTVQKLLGHTDVATSMIDTRVLNRGPGAVRTQPDRLERP